MSVPATIRLTGKLSIPDVALVSRGPTHARMTIDPAALARVERSRAGLATALRAGLGSPNPEPFYGINVGFADNRTQAPLCDPGDWCRLQENLLLSHAAGWGAPIEPEVVRAAIAIRASSLLLGYSGVRPRVARALCDFFNSGLVPRVPEFGSVGASGDLANLSHLALPLIGMGEVVLDGRVTSVTPDLLARAGFEPLSYDLADEGLGSGRFRLGPKEGLALNNGTAFMAAWLALAVDEADALADAADLALAASLEANAGVGYAFQPDVHALRPHPRVVETAARVRRLLEGSTLIRPGDGTADARSPEARAIRALDPQDDYCLRCAPQAHGAARGAIDAARSAVEIELGSLTDNPIVFPDDPIRTGDSIRVRSAGHFHGAPLALPADSMRLGITTLASISERRLAKLLDKKRNAGLPNYLVDRDDGLSSGFMILQYTAASIVNQLKAGAFPNSADSIPTGNAAEDFVSMGANACRNTHRAIAPARAIVAMELLCASQALWLRLRDVPGARPAPATGALLERLRGLGLTPLGPDRPLTPMIERVASMIRDRSLGAP